LLVATGSNVLVFIELLAKQQCVDSCREWFNTRHLSRRRVTASVVAWHTAAVPQTVAVTALTVLNIVQSDREW